MEKRDQRGECYVDFVDWCDHVLSQVIEAKRFYRGAITKISDG